MHKASHLSRSRSRTLVLSGDMLENTGLVLLTICINYISTEYRIYSNGWIPVARDKVYNQIRREWSHNYIHPQKITTDNPLKLNETKQIPEGIINIKDNIDDHTKQNNFAKVISKNEYKNDEDITIRTESPRKAKKILDRSLEHNIDIDDTNKKKKQFELEANTVNEVINTIDRSNTYEVTEDTELHKPGKGDGYDYSPPTEEKQNLTSTFIDILSKYNIKTDDNLRNYDLSRQIKTQNRLANFHTAWNPVRYNSHNHLSVDPLLAVFLSNYGFYLPSLYGIKSNYNNLYGYLASNNIHNNRPFGLYKIFSDTDSWN